MLTETKVQMDFNTPADVSASASNSLSSLSSNSSDGDGRLYPSLDHLYKASDDDEDFDSISLDDAVITNRRRRYLYPKKEFVEELRPEEVRWFYRSTGHKKWIAFIGYDSLRIECRYRALGLSNENGDIDINDKILVRGGLYEVDVEEKKCIPVYWSEDVSEIMRGLWFEEGSWQPLEEGFANQIETEHMAHFAGRRLETTSPNEMPKGPKPIIHNIKFRDFHVDWNATDEIYKYKETASSKLIRNVRQSLGWQKSGTALRRGYCYEAVMDDKPPDISHLVFVIHGIGQKMDTSAIIKSTKELRERVKYMRTKMFPEFDLTSQRAEFLPVEWRSSLKLDGDTVESITPHKMKGVRTILNSSAMDILYYTSPLYRSEITHSLRSELLRLYQMFCDRHPYFEASKGKVSIVAHSLGSVISYDIITGWSPLSMYDQLIKSLLREEESDAYGNDELLEDVDVARDKVKDLEHLMRSIRARQESNTTSLPFEIENFFSFGSPLAVFLALRGIRPKGLGTQDHIMPPHLCKRLFNIFHPSDPVSYRLEPLILKHYSTIMPLHIHHFSAPKKEPYSKIPRRAYAAFTGAIDELKKAKEGVEEGATSDGGQKEDSGAAQKFSLSGWFNNRKKKEAAEKLTAELRNMNKGSKEMEVTMTNEVIYTDEDALDKTELEYRLDFQLKEQRMENSYLSLLTSHTSYWTNKDVAFFLLTHLHPELQDQDIQTS